MRKKRVNLTRPDTKVKRSRNVSHKKILNEVAVIHHESGNYYTLNPTGTAIWTHCDKAKTLEEITGFLREEFSASGRSIDSDVRPFVESLLEEGLLEIVEF